MIDRGAQLYQRFLDGDNDAFDEIIGIYRSSLIFFINRFVNNLDSAEDIAAEVFAYIIFKPKRYNFKVTLKTYIFMLGRSRALDFIRKESKRTYIPFESLYEQPSDDGRLLEEEVIAEEEKRELYKALASLPDDYQTAIHLVYFEELKYEDAAKVMGKNKKQIENLVYNAKKAVKRYFTEEV